MVQRIAGPIEAHIRRQCHRQVGLRHRHDAAIRAMNHRYRAAPIALARDAPIAQPEDGGRLPIAQFPQPRAHLSFGLVHRQSVQEIGVIDGAGADIGFVPDGKGRRVPTRRQHHRHDGQFIPAGKIQVALVVGRAAENRAGAIVHQHEIGDIDRQPQPLDERMLGDQTGAIPPFFRLFDRRLAGAERPAFLDEGR